MSKRGPLLYLRDILDSITKVEEYVLGMTYAQFSEDEKTIDATVRNLEIIGEAARNIPEDFRDKYPEIPWEKMISMRNKVLHEYFGVDVEILWQTIQEDLPALKDEIKGLSEMSQN